MTSNALNEEVRAFFRTYTAAFEALDVEAIADCVAYPSHDCHGGQAAVPGCDGQGCDIASQARRARRPHS
jgi:hypothetical protein